jgi:hypothetical protein
MNLLLRVPVLHVLPHVALFVGDFDEELCHGFFSYVRVLAQV